MFLDQRNEHVIYGTEEIPYSAEKVVFAKGSHSYIANDISDIKEQYIRLGFHLAECRDLKYYECFGYSNFYEYVQVNFGLDKGAVSRCIGVCYAFSKRKKGSCVPTMFIDDNWKDYSYTQLCEMLPLSDKERKEIKPEMSVKQIREFKRKCKGNTRQIEKEVALTQPEEVNEEVALTQPEEVNEEVALTQPEEVINCDRIAKAIVDFSSKRRVISLLPCIKIVESNVYNRTFYSFA